MLGARALLLASNHKNSRDSDFIRTLVKTTLFKWMNYKSSLSCQVWLFLERDDAFLDIRWLKGGPTVHNASSHIIKTFIAVAEYL